MAPEVPLPEDVPTTRGTPKAGPAKRVAATDPHAVKECHKRGHDGVDANAPPKVLRRDHADPRPAGSTHVSDPDPLSFADPRSRPSADVAQSSKGAAAIGDSKSENTSFASMVGSRESIYRPEWGIPNGSMLDTPKAYQDLVDHIAPPGCFLELRYLHNDDFLRQYNVNLTRHVAMGSQLQLRFEQKAKLLKKSVAQVARRDKRIQARENEIKNLEALLEAEADMKKAAKDKSAKLSQELEDIGEEKLKAAFEEFKQYEDNRVEQRCKHGVAHGQAQINLEAIEAYDPEAKAKYIAALQALKNLKYPLVDQLEGMKDAPMDVIMAAMHLESDTGDDAPQWVRELCPSSSQLMIPVYPKPCREEKCRVVCRTHGVGSAHHARSDGVSVSVPTVVPQGLAILLADAATQTKSDEASQLLRSRSLPVMHS
nr:hypothetical protein [Tanacetum cinerariifolium]